VKRIASWFHYFGEDRGSCRNRSNCLHPGDPDPKTLGDRGEAWVFQGVRAEWGNGSDALRVEKGVLGLRSCALIRIPAAEIGQFPAASSLAGSAKLAATFGLGRGQALQLQSFDESYVDRLRDGDFRTQEHFVAYFSQLIQLKLRSRLHSAHAIEDVRQETFTRVFSALRAGKIRQPERLGAFVNSMCNNVLLEHYRASSRSSSIEDEEQQDFPATGIDVVGAIASKQIAEKVRAILEGMPERDRRLIREIFLEERDKDEVCRDFGVDRDYLRVLLHRAKQSFKTLYLKSMASAAGNAASAKL
jgi:RNA polymerase sigma-70 factor (ECF subfamily)